ncbi:hypothetical protein AVEN_137787-1 [Araneus ventricosus]|uniref:Uncharacterized protein n=1 Tax=Araneus ventricosus TaxID=182803 RepID=A0A4Y2LBE7_ARAVE|nr:hypothetical protein AVEN_137787-1 [Araneus ventricosus]
MVNSNLLLCLYTTVLEDTSFVNGVSEKDVKQAIEHMHKDYKGSPDSLSKSLTCLTDFNEVAYRCAYLFKYAPFHTALTYKAMSHALTESPYELRALLDSLSGPLKLCSLGGGPGADVIGVLAAMHNQFGFFRSSVKLVDIMSEWELTFWSVLDELRQQNYGPLSESTSEKWFDWSFMRADLQSEMSKELTEVLGTADLVTMIKFVSAAACKETSSMIEKIFRIMKPGAFILFVDNAAGGFKELISSAARKYEFIAVSTPLKHQPYINECFKNIKYGYKSCYESKVAVQLLMKSCPTNYLDESNLITNRSCNENFLSSPVSHWQKIYVPQFQNFRIGPKPVDNLMNVHETFESPPNWHGSNCSPSEFSPRPDRLEAQIDSPVNLYKSFESQSIWSSTPHALASQNGPVVKTGHDSGYSDESFESELSWDSPVYNSSPYFRASQRPSRYRIPRRKTGHSFHENESFWNTSNNNLPQHSTLMPYDENSLAPIPYRQNLQQLEQSPRISFEGIDNSVYNQSPFNSESPLHKPWSNNRHPFGILQHSERYQYELERYPIRLSKNDLLSLPPSHQCPRNYKAPRPRKVLMHQQKPYERKRSQTK